MGRKFLGKTTRTIPVSKSVLEDFLTLLEGDSIAKALFDAYDVAADFYRSMPDFKYHIPKEVREDAFYAAKNGMIYNQIPAFCVYILRKCYDQCFGIPNLLLKIIPVSILKKFFAENYFGGGVSLYDAICNICTEEYSPLSMHHVKNKLKDFTEIYVESTDMVAAVPHDIGDALTDASISCIKTSPNGLESGGMLLRTMCGRVGAINSVYDLRKVL